MKAELFILSIACASVIGGCQTEFHESQDGFHRDSTWADRQQMVNREDEQATFLERQSQWKTESQTAQQIQQSRQSRFVQEHPDLPAADKTLILSGRIRLGFSREQVEAAVGKAKKRKILPTNHSERWIYEKMELEFQNDEVTDIRMK